jgi:feruloyl esterase
MPGLGSTTATLSRFSRKWTELVEEAGGRDHGFGAGARPLTPLTPVPSFGLNPGGLEMFTYRPRELAPSPGLVVVLHGCTQNAAGYNDGAGWSTLADRHGFVLLFPQQVQANNPRLCFNWFQPGDIARGGGEAASIRQMIEHAVAEHGIDRTRIFVTGLSAGGAMAAVMLATYPDVFAAGAVVAGLPFGGAANVQQALELMNGGGPARSAAQWGALVRTASGHRGPWPKLSVWHGSADAIVRPLNAVELVKQWCDVHGLPAEPSYYDSVDGHSREVWRDRAGEDVIEFYTIDRMGHGTPLAVGTSEAQGGAAGAFMLDVGISSSFHSARFWGLTDVVVEDRRSQEPQAAEADILPPPRRAAESGPARPAPGADHPTLKSLRASGLSANVTDVIQKAFKAAGLVK